VLLNICCFQFYSRSSGIPRISLVVLAGTVSFNSIVDHHIIAWIRDVANDVVFQFYSRSSRISRGSDLSTQNAPFNSIVDHLAVQDI